MIKWRGLASGPKQKNTKKLIYKGRFLSFLKNGSYEYIQRCNCTGLVIILAVTEEGQLILTEQYRIPVAKNVIEFPAGLVNDTKMLRRESLLTAAKRELFEETGYRAKKISKLLEGPTSGGSSSDIVTIVRAEGLIKVGQGGGDETENILVHAIPIGKVDGWLTQKRKSGCLVDPKIYAGLYLMRKYNV